MKSNKKFSAALFVGLSVATVAATAQQQADGQKMEMRDVATHDSLANTLRLAQGMNPLADYKAVKSEEATEVYQPASLIGSSDIISFNGLTTLVPKRAVLAIPDAMKNRIGNHVAGNRVVHWKEFLFANRGWITTVEVSRAQAEGRQRLPEAMTERISEATQLMVATYQGGPISVLPPMEPETVDESAAEDGGTN